MSNLVVKQDRSAALVCGRRKARGRFTTRLTTPVQQSAFLARSARGGGPMVSLCGRVDFVRRAAPVLPMLNAAAECFTRGDYVAAGVRLREAVTRQLQAMVEWHGIEVKSKRPTARVYLAALVKGGIVDEGGKLWFSDMIETGNKCAHCMRVSLDMLGGSLSLLHFVLMSEPCGEALQRYDVPVQHHPMFAEPAADAPDDDDEGDGWKAVPA